MLFQFEMFTICTSFSHYENAQIYNVIAIHNTRISQKYLNIKMSNFEAKNKKNILVGYIIIHDKIYVS